MIGTDLNRAADLLRRGETVAIPTETVYGLAANALDPIAVSRIFEIKGRPTFNPLILHVKDASELEKYVQDVPPKAYELIEKFWPGPLSILLKKKDSVPSLITAGLDTVVVRSPAHPMTSELLKMLEFPLAAPSANPFKSISPTSALHVENAFGDKLPYILDGGKATLGIESTIVSFAEEQATLLRLGSLPLEKIERITGPLKRKVKKNSNPSAPGQLDKHYSPEKSIILTTKLEEAILNYSNNSISIINFGPKKYAVNHQYNLSETGDMHEAAANLFEFLHRADADDSEIILAERVPDKGLGLAINDRLERASFAES